MKQAILIIAHKDFQQVCRLVNYFQGKCDIFIHLDPTTTITPNEIEYIKKMPGVVKLYQKYKVNWGGFRLLQIELFLLEKALKHSDFEYVHLISGQDYPLKPLDYFLEQFEHSEEDYLGCFHMPSPNMDNNTFRRVQYFFFYDWIKTSSEEGIKKMWKFTYFQQKIGIRREIFRQFDNLYCGSAWFSLTRKSIITLLEYTRKHPSFYRRMRFTFVPEEIYVSTVLMNLDYKGKKIGRTNYRYVNWPYQGANHPSALKEADLSKLACSEAIFARKLDIIESAKLLDLIDLYLLSANVTIYHQNGIQEQRSLFGYSFDKNLAKSIVGLCKLLKVEDVIDLGCGPGYYVDELRRNGVIARGFDGNPYVTELSQLVMKTKYPCEKINLHEPINQGNLSDMVMLLNVGEYIPLQFQDVLITNICRLSKKYIVISWISEIDQSKGKIISPRTQKELEEIFRKYDYELDIVTSTVLQESSLMDEHNKCTYFFRKNRREGFT